MAHKLYKSNSLKNHSSSLSLTTPLLPSCSGRCAHCGQCTCTRNGRGSWLKWHKEMWCSVTHYLSLTHITVPFGHTHTVCTCWRRVVRTGNKHMPTERSSQTAGPATREKKNQISTIHRRRVCTNRKQQGKLLYAWQEEVLVYMTVSEQLTPSSWGST